MVKIRLLTALLFSLSLAACLESKGQANFTTNVSNAEIFVDGKRVKTNDQGLALTQLTTGVHRVTVNKKSSEWLYLGEKEFFVQKGKLSEVYIPVEKFATQVTLAKLAQELGHTKNKLKKTKTPIEEIAKTSIEEIAKTPIEEIAKKPIKKTSKLAALTGQLKISTRIFGAEIFVDGKKRAFSTNDSVLISVNEGLHDIVIRKITPDWEYHGKRSVYVGQNTVASSFIPVKKVATQARLNKIKKQRTLSNTKYRKKKYSARKNTVPAKKTAIYKKKSSVKSTIPIFNPTVSFDL